MHNTCRLAIVAGLLILLVSLSAALDINDTRSLDYYSGGEHRFQVDTDGTITAFGDLDMQGVANITNFFAGSDGCGGSEAVNRIFANGTYECVNVGEEGAIQDLQDVLDEGNQSGGIDIDMEDASRIINLLDPENPQDAATRSWVLEQVGTGEGIQNLSHVLAQGNVANMSIDMDTSDIVDIGELRFDQAILVGEGSISAQSNDVLIGNNIDADSLGTSTVIGSDSEASGEWATIVGRSATLDGDFSMILGHNAEALADDTTVIGQYARAIGEESTAIGRDADAEGDRSIALGQFANASGEGSMAIGYGSTSPNPWEATFGNLSGGELDVNVTGNMTVHENMTVMKGLAVQEGVDVMDEGVYNVDTIEFSSSPITIDGGTEVAIGMDSSAHSWAVAIGNNAGGDGTQSVAIGHNAGANEGGSLALGVRTIADASNSVAIGPGGQSYTTASAEGAMALGHQAQAPNEYEATFGNLDGEELSVNVTGNATIHGAGGLVLVNGELDMNENAIENCDQINGVDCDDLGEGGDPQNLSHVLEQGNVANQSIDMDGSVIENIGDSGTDFDSSGGLTLAGDLDTGDSASITGDVAERELLDVWLDEDAWTRILMLNSPNMDIGWTANDEEQRAFAIRNYTGSTENVFEVYTDGETVVGGDLDVSGDILGEGMVIWDDAEQHILNARLENDSLVVDTDASLSGGGLVSLGDTLDTLSVNWGEADGLDGEGEVVLENLSAGQGLDGVDYDGTAPRTWNVDAADESITVGASGISVDWSEADALDDEGNISDFSAAADLTLAGSVLWGNAADLDSSGNVDGLSEVDTGDLEEGTNLYFTDSRAQDAVGAGDFLSWDEDNEEFDVNLGDGLRGDGSDNIEVGEGTGIDVSSNAVGIDTNVVAQLGEVETVTEDWTFTQDLQVQGDLDVWGTVTNTDVEDLNVNGSIVPPDGFSGDFDLGNETRQWNELHLAGDANVGGDLTVSGISVTLPDGSISNDELADDDITLNLDSSLGGGEESVALGSTSSTLSVAWDDAADLGSGGGLENDVVGSSELDDNLCGEWEVLLIDGGSWGCVDRDAVGNATDLTGGEGINPESITDGDTLSVAWVDAGDLDSSGNVDGLSEVDTGDLEEGTNLYYTDGRVRSVLSGSAGDGLVWNASGEEFEADAADDSIDIDTDGISVVWGDAADLGDEGGLLSDVVTDTEVDSISLSVISDSGTLAALDTVSSDEIDTDAVSLTELNLTDVDSRYVNQWETWDADLDVNGDIETTSGNVGSSGDTRMCIGDRCT